MTSAWLLPDASGIDVIDSRGQCGQEPMGEFQGVGLER